MTVYEFLFIHQFQSIKIPVYCLVKKQKELKYGITVFTYKNKRFRENP